jgi:DNA ligase (NAD+)
MSNPALDEKYIHYIAKNRNIQVKDAVKLVDECIKGISANYNIDYNVIYDAVFSEEGLKYIIETLDIMPVIKNNKDCNQLTVEECFKSTTCFYMEKYGCLSRKIPDADLINDNPDDYVTKYLGKTDDLRRLVEIANYIYHNFGDSNLTDNAFESIKWYLNQREKIKQRALDKVGAPPIEKIRTQLEYPLPSLDKVLPGTTRLIQFLSQFKDKKCNWSLKLDGLTGMLIYEKGILKKINTRGDGDIGGDVFYLKDYITSIPHKIDADYLVVRGEFIISKEIWEKKYKDSYANARAFVAGKINSGFISSALNDIHFVSYEIMNDGNKMVPSTSQSLKILDNLGFKTVENATFSKQPTIFELMELYQKKRLTSQYYIDGLVLRVDEPQDSIKKLSQGGGVYNPTNSVAFKMQLEEQRRKTKVLTVEWNISRYGKYIPVVIYEAVYIDGNRLTRATGHNGRKISDNFVGRGTEILVIRAGDVIPQIKDFKVDENIEPIFPDNTKPGYEWHWDRADIVLDEIETNKEVKIKRILHFFETIEVPRLKQKTIEKFYEVGYETAESIIKAKVTDMIKIKGIGKKTAESFYDTIRLRMTTTPPDRFVEASTFKSGIGRVLLKQLFREFPHILDYNEEQIRDAFKKKKVAGFGVGRIDNVAKNIPLLRAYLDSFAKEDIKQSIQHYIDKLNNIKKNGYNPMIDGKIFVLTQMPFTTDYDLEDAIYFHNGMFASTVTSKTEAVICGTNGDISEKMKKASELGIPVLFLQEFSERYNVNLKRFE